MERNVEVAEIQWLEATGMRHEAVRSEVIGNPTPDA